MKPSLRPGLSRTNRIVVDPARTISFMGEEGRVSATHWFVRNIEHTCRDLILEHTDPGEDSVGIEVGIKQSAATPPGMTVEITATVTAVRAEVEPIGGGTHARFVVDVAKTLERVNAKVAKHRAR